LPAYTYIHPYIHTYIHAYMHACMCGAGTCGSC
jgi:hypothetical protein